MIMQMNSIGRLMGLCMLLVLASCESAVNQPEQVGPQFAFEPMGECRRGEERLFELEYVSSEDHDFQWVLDVSSSPFMLGECLCDIQEYYLEAPSFPGDEIIELTDNNENRLDYERGMDPESGWAILIINADQIGDATVAINLDYSEDAPSTAPGGSGLCIIDNLGGDPIPMAGNDRVGDQGYRLDSIFTTPAYITWTNTFQGTLKKTFIPARITD